MPYILQLDSSADLGSSASRRLTGEFAQRWASASPGREIRHRDLHVNPLPHLPTNTLHFTTELRPEGGTRPAPETERLQAELLEELSGAAGVVIGAPMYNFSMPSTLKAWLDYVHVIGANSPAGEGFTPLLHKPVTLVSARATPTGADVEADFVLGPFFAILGGFMSMTVSGFVVHTEPPAAPGDFHRPIDDVRRELLAHADSWS
ncbi:NAD(P)H-dependent oxidoreductase [soil metagenome]